MNRREKEQFLLRLLEQHQDAMRRLCRGYLNDPVEAEDLFQEVLINIWNHLGSFRGEAQLSTWAYRVTVNTALMYQRKKGTEAKHRQAFSETMPPPTTHSQEDGSALKQRLYNAIEQLAKPDRLLVSLMLENLTYKEIAATLDLSVSNVGAKVNRVKKKLAKLMQEKSHG